MKSYVHQYNEIDHVWAISKNYYHRNNEQNGYAEEALKEMWRKVLSAITPEIEKKNIDMHLHCEKLIKENFNKYIRQPKFVINVWDDTDSSDKSCM